MGTTPKKERRINMLLPKPKYDVVYFLAECGNEQSMKEIIDDIISNGKEAISAEQANIVLRYLNILIEKNDHDALLSIGTLYYTGLGEFVPQDYAKAMFFYERASQISELKNDWALCNLGYCYEYGRACQVDYRKAYYYFALSATLGNANAMYKLGDMYYYGSYVEKDLDASFYWYSSARQQKTEADRDYQSFLDASIAMRLGRAFLYGEGTEIDLDRAVSELETAESLFWEQVHIGNIFAQGQLSKTQNLLEVVKNKLRQHKDIKAINSNPENIKDTGFRELTYDEMQRAYELRKKKREERAKLAREQK
jgi:hypothetical protein